MQIGITLIQLQFNIYNNKMNIFHCDKKEIESGQFSIDELKEFSKKNWIDEIIIPYFAVIINGEIEYTGESIN